MTSSLFDEGPFAPCPAPFNMAAHTLAAADLTPEKVALEVLAAPGEISERWTYAALRAAILGTAGGLAALGIRPGDRILLRLGNSADFPIAFFAANALGAIPVPSSGQLTPPEFEAIRADLDPALVVLGLPAELPPRTPCLDLDGLRALRGHPPATFAETAPDAPAYMVYTSGTSGRPKGVVHGQRAAWARRMMWDGWYGLTPQDRVLHAGAFNWTYTLGVGLTDPWAAGATALVYAGPADRHVWPRLAAAHRPTIFAAAPGVYRQMMDAPELGTGFEALRHGLSAGEGLPPSVRAAWEGATGRPIFEALGMSEISTYVSFAPSVPTLPGRTGRPQHGRRVAILPEAGEDPVPLGTEGILAVSRRDPGLMLGYWRRPEETAASFRGEWFVTGDIASMDPDGTIIHLGRNDDLLNAGGFRVSPAEIEAVLLSHPGVAEAAVIDRAVAPGVSVIAAFYVPAGDPLHEATLAEHCGARLARYKCPRAFRAVGALPRDRNGKLVRRSLRELQE
jgi:4-hydroxybenzoate-CoA ligase